ncbi:MAG: bestrophin family protein [bacterium]|jgi:putative membrane protein
MVLYNPKDWLKAIFRFHKSDTFRTLFPSLILIGLYAWGIVYLEANYLKLGEKSNAKNLTVMHSLLGFAISMVLVFRTNTAYDRWWEGRKLWGLLLINSRSMAIKLNVMMSPNNTDSKAFFRQAIPLYAFSLKRHLTKETTQFELDENPHPELPDLNAHAHLPNKIAESILTEIHKLHKQKEINDIQMLMLNNEWQSFKEICGACERIKNTPIPYSYSSFIKKFIFLYAVTMPFGFALSLGFFTIPVTVFLFYILTSLELIAGEIEDPFGNGSNDLPMGKIAENIKQNIEEILA